MQDALDLGWTLIGYEAAMDAAPSSDLMSDEVTSWREREQAVNLASALPAGPLLVWCGNGHLTKVSPGLPFQPMAQAFWEATGIEPFSLDQTTSVLFPGKSIDPWVDRFRDELEVNGGTAGFLTSEHPSGWRQCWADAFLLSVENELA